MKVVGASDRGFGGHTFSPVNRPAEQARLLETMRRELRSGYDRLVEEPVPAQFARILDALERPQLSSETP